MTKWVERFGELPDAALCFMRELKVARLGALADSEGWMPLVLTFERLGKFLVDDRKANLGKAKNEIIELATLGANRIKVGAGEPIPPSMLVKLAIDGRNEEFHGGSAARRFTNHCLELGLLLEDGLKSFLVSMKIKYVMTPNPTCAELDLPVYHARRLMLEHSFTWLPVEHDGHWLGINDHAVVAYTSPDSNRYAETIKNAIARPAGSGLGCVKLELYDENDETSAVVAGLKDRPILVNAKGNNRAIGIVTAFDLL